MSRVPHWRNQRTAQVVEGLRDGDELILRRARGIRYSDQGEPATQPGDLWHLAADPGQAFITIAVDAQAAALPTKRLRHLSLRGLPVAGRLTIERQIAAHNDFGRRTEATRTLAADVPAALDRDTPGNLALNPAGLEQLSPRRAFVAALPSEIVPLENDSVLFRPANGGPEVTLRIVHAFPLAARLWRLETV